MTYTIEQAVQMYPETVATDWRMVGATPVHRDATVTAPHNRMIGGVVRGGEITGGVISGGVITGGVISGGEITGGVVRGGDITGGVVRGCDITGGVISGGEITGGRITGGTWHRTPPQYEGTRHYINAASPTEIAVGCEVRPADWWLANYEAVGVEHNYTPAQIEEYGRALRLIAGELRIMFPNVEVQP